MRCESSIGFQAIVRIGRFAAACGLCALASFGCGEARPSQSQAQLLSTRAASDTRNLAEVKGVASQLVRRAKVQYDEYRAGRRPAAPSIDILIISGGGDWGAFGAGFLKGWGRVPRSDQLAKPEFAAVTGVSTGAMIAPFAFLGDEPSIDRVVHFYRNPQQDWVEKRGWFYFMPSNSSLTTIPGLEQELRTALDLRTINRIADAGADGRLLAIGTTNLDDGSPRAFDLVAEAHRAQQTGDLDRVRTIVLASAAIPGAFPFRIIDGQMYVDGAITGNIMYGGRAAEEDTLAPEWRHLYPALPIPTIRFWVIFNNQFRPPPQVVEPRWLNVVTRALETSTRASTLTSIRHLVAMSQTAELKWHADIQVRVVSIPGEWTPPKAGAFNKETMNALVDLGERMGADPKSWMTPLP